MAVGLLSCIVLLTMQGGPVARYLATPTVTATATPTFTPTPTDTPDPFDGIPTATPMSAGHRASIETPTPTSPGTYLAAPQSTATPQAEIAATTPALNSPLPYTGVPPDRLVIPKLGLDVPVEPVGMLPSGEIPGVVEWDVPGYRAAGWLDTTAPFGVPGNTVLDGHHNVKGEVFNNLWTLKIGDEVTLCTADACKAYRVTESVIVPEKGQPVEVRLENARYIQQTDDERVTLITCWPYENNTHRAIVVAHP